MSKAISNFLGIAPLASPPPVPVVLSEHKTTISEDADLARDNLRKLMLTATDALSNALNVAVQSESPRAYEVVANLIVTAAELNSKLLDTHSTELKVTGAAKVSNTQNNTTTNNVVFQGTPAELSAMLKTMN